MSWVKRKGTDRGRRKASRHPPTLCPCRSCPSAYISESAPRIECRATIPTQSSNKSADLEACSLRYRFVASVDVTTLFLRFLSLQLRCAHRGSVVAFVEAASLHSQKQRRRVRRGSVVAVAVASAKTASSLSLLRLQRQRCRVWESNVVASAEAASSRPQRRQRCFVDATKLLLILGIIKITWYGILSSGPWQFTPSPDCKSRATKPDLNRPGSPWPTIPMSPQASGEYPGMVSGAKFNH